MTGRVTALSRDGGHFLVRLGDRAVTARRLLIATGLRDELPEVPGLAARWGTDVLHCPYCHGWEVRDKRVGILATGPGAGLPRWASRSSRARSPAWRPATAA